ncbi:MAG: PilZ domain-containing protein [Planctomycetota bacterium]
MPTNSSYMRLAGSGELDTHRQERRAKGRMPMEGLRCNLGKIIDLSPGGVCLRRGGVLSWSVGKPLVLVFNSEGEKVAVQAQVARVMKDGIFSRRYGMQFVNLSPKQNATLMRFAKDCRPQLSMGNAIA